VTPDSDGVARHHQTRIASPEGERLSLAAQLARLFAGDATAFNAMPNPFLFCPLAQRPELIPIAEVMTAWREEQQGNVAALSRDHFAGRIVLIGSLATGLPQDREVTPVNESEAGVIITAMATDNLLSGRFYRESPPWLDVVLIALLAALPLSVRSSRPRAFLVITSLFPIVYLGATLLAILAGRWMLPLVGPLLAWLVSATGLLMLYWFQERAGGWPCRPWNNPSRPSPTCWSTICATASLPRGPACKPWPAPCVNPTAARIRWPAWPKPVCKACWWR
jgi:hypothetical protein